MPNEYSESAKTLRKWRAMSGCLVLDVISLNLVDALTAKGVRRAAAVRYMKDTVSKVIAIFGKTVFTWPKTQSKQRKHRRDSMIIDRRTMTYPELAMKWNLSERRVRVLLSETSVDNNYQGQSIIELQNIFQSNLIASGLISKDKTFELIHGVFSKSHCDLNRRSSVYLADYRLFKHEIIERRIRKLAHRSTADIAMIMEMDETEVIRLQRTYEKKSARLNGL